MDWRRADVAAGAFLVLLSLAIYLRSPSPRMRSLDPTFSLLTSHALVSSGSWNLAPYFARHRGAIRTVAVAEPTRPRQERLPYQLKRRDGALLYIFPPGTPLLCAPMVALLRPFGVSVVTPAGRYSRRLERRLLELFACLVAAATVGVVFTLVRHEVPLAPAATVALLAALGSPLWTNASRLLWSQSWSVLLVGLCLLELLRIEDDAKPRPIWLGVLLSALFWVRPSNALFVVCWVAFVAIRHRGTLRSLVTTGAVGCLAFLGWSLSVWGHWLPPYIAMNRPWGRLAWTVRAWDLLFSADHGLFAFSPVLLVVLWVLVRRGVPTDRRPLVVMALAASVLHLATCALSGASIGMAGPRYQVELVPILAWLGALAWRSAHELRPPAVAGRRRLVGRVAFAALAAASLLASIGGVYTKLGQLAAARGNRPDRVDFRRELRRQPLLEGARLLIERGGLSRHRKRA